MAPDKDLEVTESFSDGIFEAETYEAQKPTKRDFLAWHKPRKQFVRHHQWCDQICRLLDDSPPEDGTLRYLGLPAADLLDLRYFHSQICEKKNVDLRFLGFNRGAQPRTDESIELNISLDEVRHLEKVDASSSVISDDFCKLADLESVAWNRTEATGPYDVINLDLCDGFAKGEPFTAEETMYGALNSLLSLQAKRKAPWLLLLTTRTTEEDIHDKVYKILLDTYLQNLTQCPSFQEESEKFYGISDDSTLSKALSVPNTHLDVFLISLCKWMQTIAMDQGATFQKIEVKSTIGYRVHEGAPHDDLVSMAIKFVPVLCGSKDRTGLSQVKITVPSECDSSVKILKRVKCRKSADEILANDQTLHDEMVNSSASLLALARYDIDAYREWVLSN